MDYERIFSELNGARVDWILIGGMNFFLKHSPVTTYDVDIFVEDVPPNLSSLNAALRTLKAQWGPTDQSWGDIPADPAWLATQPVFCMTTAAGPLDVFRSVAGLEDGYVACKMRAEQRQTSAGIPYLSLSDRDMLRCQEVLSLQEQKQERLRVLRDALKGQSP